MPQKRKRGRPSQGTPTVDVQENNAEPAQQTPTQETVPAKKPRRKTKRFALLFENQYYS